jgi:hypothetical protein
MTRPGISLPGQHGASLPVPVASRIDERAGILTTCAKKKGWLFCSPGRGRLGGVRHVRCHTYNEVPISRSPAWL